jgi:hypothetical protein
MTLGLADRQGSLFDEVVRFCEAELPPTSVFALLHRERDQLFPDQFFADLFSAQGRRSVPPSVVATVMVLQRLEGLSDREAVERYCFDTRWRYATGVGSYANGGWASFSHTVLVDMRERLRRSQRPDRVFEVALQAAIDAGLVGRRRVLDSTPLYDAVATMDTVTLIRSAIRGLLRVASDELVGELTKVLARDDDYASAGKPACDWDDPVAREALVDELALDAYRCLMVLDGRKLGAEVTQAASLLAAVAGQDLELSADLEVFRIARRVAANRIISTVDSETRHGHKTAARGFDGYKGHVATDPDSEIITATTVSAGNAGDASVAEDLIADLVKDKTTKTPTSADPTSAPSTSAPPTSADPTSADPTSADTTSADTTTEMSTEATTEANATSKDAGAQRAKVYGDQAYGAGAFQAFLEDNDIDSGCKTQAPSAAGGMFTKASFDINLLDNCVTCPNAITVAIARNPAGEGTAYFGDACVTCPLRAQCTKAAGGRSIHIGIHEASLARARARQATPEWAQDYRATRPKVERKLGHLMIRKHGGRRVRVRGRAKVAADFSLLAAACNLARLAVLGLHHSGRSWATAAT